MSISLIKLLIFFIVCQNSSPLFISELTLILFPEWLSSVTEWTIRWKTKISLTKCESWILYVAWSEPTEWQNRLATLFFYNLTFYLWCFYDPNHPFLHFWTFLFPYITVYFIVNHSVSLVFISVIQINVLLSLLYSCGTWNLNFGFL